jgi:hypothetical protein
LAERLAKEGDLLDSCAIGWDSVNEPDAGLVEIPDLNDFPPSQEFRYVALSPFCARVGFLADLCRHNSTHVKPTAI